MKICEGEKRYLLVVSTQRSKLIVVDLLSIEENRFKTKEVDLNEGSVDNVKDQTNSNFVEYEVFGDSLAVNRGDVVTLWKLNLDNDTKSPEKTK